MEIEAQSVFLVYKGLLEKKENLYYTQDHHTLVYIEYLLIVLSWSRFKFLSRLHEF